MAGIEDSPGIAGLPINARLVPCYSTLVEDAYDTRKDVFLVGRRCESGRAGACEAPAARCWYAGWSPAHKPGTMQCNATYATGGAQVSGKKKDDEDERTKVSWGGSLANVAASRWCVQSLTGRLGILPSFPPGG